MKNPLGKLQVGTVQLAPKSWQLKREFVKNVPIITLKAEKRKVGVLSIRSVRKQEIAEILWLKGCGKLLFTNFFMGMFDWITVSKEILPNTFDTKFQTKDFCCNMDVMRLEKDGVFVMRFDWDETTHSRTNIEWVNLKWREEFRIYGVHEIEGWIEYICKFDKGKLLITRTNNNGTIGDGEGNK